MTVTEFLDVVWKHNHKLWGQIVAMIKATPLLGEDEQLKRCIAMAHQISEGNPEVQEAIKQAERQITKEPEDYFAFAVFNGDWCAVAGGSEVSVSALAIIGCVPPDKLIEVVGSSRVEWIEPLIEEGNPKSFSEKTGIPVRVIASKANQGDRLYVRSKWR